MSWEDIDIDGAAGEGGGQVLRSALSLSIVTGRPFRIRAIRAGRERPGLLRQHLTAVRAAAEVSGAEVRGAELGSRELAFGPRARRGGDHRFAIGSAGSVNLVLQAILLPLALGPEPSRVTIEGGTHNQGAPPHAFLVRTLGPLLGRMGLAVSLELDRWGFYPAGGGRIVADIGTAARLQPLELVERGAVRAIRIEAVSSGLPPHVVEREVRTAREALAGRPLESRTREVASPGPGNVVWIEVECEHVTEVFTGFGRKGVPAEEVARRAADEALAWLAADVPVGEHLADQLLLPLALAGRGAFRTLPPSLHTMTNIDVIGRFLDVPIEVRQDDEGCLVRVG